MRVPGPQRSPLGGAIYRLWFFDWGFDWIYDRLLVQPYVMLARVNRSDVIDLLYQWIGRLSELAWRGLILTENGRVRTYAMGIALGTVILIGLAVFL